MAELGLDGGGCSFFPLFILFCHNLHTITRTITHFVCIILTHQYMDNFSELSRHDGRVYFLFKVIIIAVSIPNQANIPF